jgi:hypothetical protein
VARVVLEMCSHAIDGAWDCINPSVASRASHFLVGMTIQGVFNRDANPLATPSHFAAFVHLPPLVISASPLAYDRLPYRPYDHGTGYARRKSHHEHKHVHPKLAALAGLSRIRKICGHAILRSGGLMRPTRTANPRHDSCQNERERKGQHITASSKENVPADMIALARKRNGIWGVT